MRTFPHGGTFPHVHTFLDPFLKTEAEKLETTSESYLNAGENKSLRQVHKCILKPKPTATATTATTMTTTTATKTTTTARSLVYVTKVALPAVKY